MRRFVARILACSTIVLITLLSSQSAAASAGAALGARQVDADPGDSCTIAPFVWNIVGSNVTREGRLVKVDFLAIGIASHSGADCSLAGEEVVVRDRAFVLFEPTCGQDGTTPLRGQDPLDYGSGIRMEFRGPITGVVTCREGGMRTLDMDVQAKSEKGARLFLHQIGEVDLTARMLTTLAATSGELVLR